MQTPIKLVHLQLALIDITARYEPLEEYSALNRALGNVITDTPIVLPFPADTGFPNDIPIVQASNSLRGIALNIGQRRIDYSIQVNSPGSLQEYERSAGILLERYKTGGFHRFGMVGQFVIDINEPLKWIRSMFLKEAWSNCEEVFVRFNRKSTLHGQTINHLYQFQEAFLREGGKGSSKVLVQLDINTLRSSNPQAIGALAFSLLKEKIKLFRAAQLREVLL